MAAAVVEGEIHPGINLKIAVAAARCACLWIDTFKEMMASDEPMNIKDALEQSRQSAFERAQGILRYPSGQPTIRAILAIGEVFILSFDPDERELVRELIYPETARN